VFLSGLTVKGKLTVDVLALVGRDISCSELTVGGLGCAVTAGKVVDDESGELVARNVLEVVLNDRNAGTSVTNKLLASSKPASHDNVHPKESSDLSDLGGLGRQSAVGHAGSGSRDLLGVLLVGIDGARGEGVTAKGDGRGTSSISSTCSDGALLDRTRGGKSASNGRSQHSRVEALHVADWNTTSARCRSKTWGSIASYIYGCGPGGDMTWRLEALRCIWCLHRRKTGP
jgi:hypothetical protein